jgi:NAD(P)-dependent dehydrogenase (short-subunit alcohol dehydrogenase family)
VAGIISSPLMAKYCSSKWALEAISDAARVELAYHGVSVSVVEPAYVKSEIFGKQEEKSADFADVYGHVVPDPAFGKRCIERASEPTVTSEAILHALVDPHPRTRYVRTVPCCVVPCAFRVFACLRVRA